MSSPSVWFAADRSEVHKGDVVIGPQGYRARIVRVHRDTGLPVLLYEEGDLAGSEWPTYPILIQRKTEGSWPCVTTGDPE